ncbi:uncharacterized protein LOC134714628 isoform X1 [Mytilus trossulus]|uniref:uncharacterized protein LOC134714628 isoform X1 n=3 Tax=Mytilus trossulus TaxID=6551 RepID=UPI0030046531
MSKDILGTCSQVLKILSEHVSSDNEISKTLSPENENGLGTNQTNSANLTQKVGRGIATVQTVVCHSPEPVDKMPILANALNIATPFQAINPQECQKTEIFFMSADGSIKRRFLPEDLPAKRRHPAPTLMPGTGIPYRTPGQSSRNKNGKIKRPMNAFMIWARTARGKLAEETPNASNAEISVKLGELWSHLAKEEKQKYYMEAERVKARHRQDFPDWIYQPEPSTKKGVEECGTTLNHRQLWSKYNESRPKMAPSQIAPTPQGPFINFIGQQNRPILPRNVMPIQPVTMLPQGNQFVCPPGLRIVQPMQYPMYGQQFQPRNFLNGNQIPYQDVPRLQTAGIPDYNAVQNVTIIHPKPFPVQIPAPRGRPPVVTERLKAVPANLQAKIQAEAAGKTDHHPIVLESKDCNATEKNEKTNKECKKDTPETSDNGNNDKPVEDKEQKTKKAQRTRKKDNDNKKSSSKKSKKADQSNTLDTDKTTDDDSELASTTLPGSTTQLREEHPEDFWPFPFPPAEQESHVDDMFEGPIDDTIVERDPYNTYFCREKEKGEDDKLNVDVSSWQQYLRHDQQQKPSEQSEKLDTFFVEEKAEIVNCPSDFDICPIPVALTLTRQEDDNRQNDKMDTSFGNSITNAINVLGGHENEERYESNSAIEIDSENSSSDSDISSKNMVIDCNDHSDSYVNHNAISGRQVTAPMDTRPLKKRTNRYIHNMEDSNGTLGEQQISRDQSKSHSNAGKYISIQIDDCLSQLRKPIGTS